METQLTYLIAKATRERQASLAAKPAHERRARAAHPRPERRQRHPNASRIGRLLRPRPAMQ